MVIHCRETRVLEGNVPDLPLGRQLPFFSSGGDGAETPLVECLLSIHAVPALGKDQKFEVILCFIVRPAWLTQGPVSEITLRRKDSIKFP